MVEGEDAIVVDGLAKSYAGKPALRGLSFRVPTGQVCGFLGPNGAGKSTTLKILAGVLEPDSGSARIAGFDVLREPLEARAALGYVPESGALYGLLTPREHLLLAGELHGLPEGSVGELVRESLVRFGLLELADRRVDTLSKGQKQKTLLASALLHSPRVILFDEPLNGLDVTAVRQLRATIRALANAGHTVLYCSHILDVVERLCERAIIIDSGLVVADAPTAELVARSAESSLESVFHSLVRADDVEGMGGLFTESGDGAPP